MVGLIAAHCAVLQCVQDSVVQPEYRLRTQQLSNSSTQLSHTPFALPADQPWQHARQDNAMLQHEPCAHATGGMPATAGALPPEAATAAGTTTANW